MDKKNPEILRFNKIAVALMVISILSCSNATIYNDAIKKQGAARYYYDQMDYIRAEKSCLEALELWREIRESDYNDIPQWRIDNQVEKCETMLEFLPKVESPPTKSLVPLQVQGNKLYVKAFLNQKEWVTLLLDTGATCTVIHPEIASRLGIQPEEGDPVHPVRLVGGIEIEVPFVKLQKINIGDTAMKDLRIGVYLVFPDRPTVHGILGMDYLGRFKMSIDRHKSKLVLFPYDI